jgi:hypothetical protein
LISDRDTKLLAAFKAGVTPSRIARQFGLSRSDVRNALAIEHRAEEPSTKIGAKACSVGRTIMPQKLYFLAALGSSCMFAISPVCGETEVGHPNRPDSKQQCPLGSYLISSP